MKLKHIVARVEAEKREMLEFPGGVKIAYQYNPVLDRHNQFAFVGPLNLETAWLWPKLYVRAMGTLRDDGRVIDRISVYDFEERVAMGYDSKNGFIVPYRHMFSSGYCLLFKSMGWAEGFQNYQSSDAAAILEEKTIPECFMTGKYQNIGEETFGQERCLHISGPDDDIWIALDKNFMVHHREQRFSDGGPKRNMSVRSYRRISRSSQLFLPEELVVQDFFPNDFGDAGQMLFEARIQLTGLESGKLDQEFFTIAFPAGIRVTDLVHG